MEFTPEQKKAIETVGQNLVVTAGAGAGKTRVLVARILYILEQGLADIDDIVAITYTNKAALEIRERLRKEMMKRKHNGNISKSLERLGIAYIGTIHSFCLRLLKENPVEADIDPNIKVLEEYRADAWLKDSVRATIIDNLENKHVFQLTLEMGFPKLLSALYAAMVKMQNQGINPLNIDKMAISEDEKIVAMLIEKSYEAYSLKKEQQIFMDYEDILQKALGLLESNKKILRGYREKFKFILIDEYQDLNFVQDGILRLLGEGTNLFVVGDKKQSIYGFRGARVELFEKLRRDLESRGQALNLKDNFRSDERIIKYVNESFEHIMGGYEAITAHRCHVNQKNICFLTPESQGLMGERRQLEGEFIAKKILEMMADESVEVYDKDTQEYRKPTFRDFCILLRRKTHLKHYINAFKAYGIPFHVADTGSLMESPGVKDLLYALNTIEFQDDINLYGTLARLLKISDDSLAEYVLTGQELIFGLKEDTGHIHIAESLAEAFQLIRRWCKIKDRVSLRELAGTIVKDTKLLSFAAQSDLLETESLFKFLDLCRDYDRQGYTLSEFLGELSDFGQEQQEAIDVSEGEDVVRFITIHSSKGLEFPIVILADSGQEISYVSSEILFEPESGLALKKDKEKWETVKKVLEQKEIEEAKRLLYVALTRARDYLLISGEMKSERKDSFLKWLNQEAAENQGVPMDVIRQPSDIIINDVRIPNLKCQKQEPEKTPILPENIPISSSYSVTSLGEFLRCPRRYYLSKLMGISEMVFYKKSGGLPRLSAGERGTIVHELIEKIYRDKIRVENPEELLAGNEYALAFEDREIIERCLQNYLKSDLYNALGVIHTEMPFIYCLKQRCYVTGKIDYLIFEEDGVTVVDFKTNALIDSSLYEIYRLQVMAYALAVSEIYGVKPKKAIIASLFENRIIEVDTSQHSLAECRTQICSIIDKIQNGAFQEKAPKQATCDICMYKGTLCG